MKRLVIIAALASVVLGIMIGNLAFQFESNYHQLESDLDRLEIELEELVNEVETINEDLKDQVANKYDEEASEFDGVKYLAFSDGSYMFAYNDEAARTTNYYFSKNGYSFERDWD